MRKVLLFLSLLLLTTSLDAQQIRSVDTKVFIDENGDALIKQSWDVNVVSGTEWYIPIGNLNGSSVRGLQVSENGIEFENDGREWNTDRSRVQKTGRCGIVDKGKDGVELCWGQGEYGDHKWDIQYVVLGLVQSLEDYDAFNYMFINPGLVAPPQHASISFHRLDGGGRFGTDSTRFWFFGCEGESALQEDGSIFFETDRPMPSDGRLIAMMRFDKGVFAAYNQRDMKFEKMQKKAFKGSSYAKKSFLGGLSWDTLIDYFFMGLILLVSLGGVVFIVIGWIKDKVLKALGRQWSPKLFGSTSVKGWAREAPFGGSLPDAAYLFKEGTRLTFKDAKPEMAIGAYFLRWIQGGSVVPVKAEDGHYDLQFPKMEPDFRDDCEKSLYHKAFEAAGANRILEKGEFDSWAKKHYSSLAGWPKALVSEGRSKYSGFKGDKIEEAANLLKFKNFLNDFTLAGEREVPEVALWGQYLEFAQFFGIADKVAKGFAKMYPRQFEDFSKQYYGLDSATMSTVLNSWSSMASRAYRSAYSEKLSSDAASRSGSGSSGGFGGHSSFGGGGGFSGGGFGGGSR